jgi:hypothetical protein
MNNRQPQSYKDWMNELNIVTSAEDMVAAAHMMGRLNPKTAKHDIALVLASKYKTELSRTSGRSMLIRTIREKYDLVAKSLFNSRMQSLVGYVLKHEPGFNASHGKTTLGFVDSKIAYDDKGRISRTPLGFLKRPDSVDKDGNIEPGLGFLDDGSSSIGGGLGFL